MTRLFTGAILAVCCSAGLLAQDPPAPTNPQDEKDKLVTVTGCLRAGEESGTFVLTNVKWPKKDKPVGTSGSGTADDPPATGTTLRLVGSPAAVQMSEHIGHTVEVTGVLVDEARPTQEVGTTNRAAASAREQSATQPPARQVPDSPQTLNVRTVKMVEENCSGR